jgi:hypothetical protein
MYGLVGLKVTFANPAGSVTFVQGKDLSGFLLFSEIRGQIEASTPTLTVSVRDSCVVIEGKSPIPVSIGSPAAESARTLLGFDGSANGYVSGKVYGGPNATTLPRLVTITPSPVQESFVVVTEE